MVAQPPRHKQRSLSPCVPSFLAPHLQDAPDPDSTLTVLIFRVWPKPARFWKNFQMVDGSPSSVGSLVMHISLWNNLMLLTCTRFSGGCRSSRIGPEPPSTAGGILRIESGAGVRNTQSGALFADYSQANPTELIGFREFSTKFPEKILVYLKCTQLCLLDKFLLLCV